MALKRIFKVLVLLVTMCSAILLYLHWMGTAPVSHRQPEIRPFLRKEAASHGDVTLINFSNVTHKYHLEHDAIDAKIWQSFSWNKVPDGWVSVINRRKSMLQDRCRNIRNVSYSQNLSAKWILVDDKHKLILCFMYKAASRNWKIVYNMLTGHFSSSNLTSNKNKKQTFTRLVKFNNSERIMRMKNYLKVLVVRHPLERIVSVFKEQVQHQLGPGVRAYINQQYNRNISKSKDMTFWDLLRYIADNGADNIHWNLVDDFCRPCYIGYDIIVHHETLQTDAANLFHLLDAENLISQFPQSHRKVEIPSNQTLIHKYYSRIDQRLARQVWNIYKEDASYFGYKLDL